MIMDQNNDVKHIVLGVLENSPEEYLDNLINEINIPKNNVGIRKQELGVMMASIEWLVPTALVVYIAKSYFDGFLKEAGKDHYIALKEWYKKYSEKARLIKIVTLVSGQSIDKRSEDSQSRSISLLFQLSNNKVIKLLFDDDLSQVDWENAIDALFELMNDHYENNPNDKLTELINTLDTNQPYEIIVIIDKETKELAFYDLNRIMKKYRNRVI
jgi:hypothetical protein